MDPAPLPFLVKWADRQAETSPLVPEERAVTQSTLAPAEKAIQLDPLSAESYDALGAAFARETQWDQAEKNFRRAIETQPCRLESHGHFAMCYFLPLGTIEEAIRHLRIAEKSSPIFTFFLGGALADAGRTKLP